MNRACLVISSVRSAEGNEEVADAFIEPGEKVANDRFDNRLLVILTSKRSD